jgi:maltose alpha-D-glucosyltransferase/alpha-amylase
VTTETSATPARSRRASRERSDPSWYKDAVIYELHIRSFFDANGDGIGDFKGLTRKLDYLADLGVTALWLLPFYPSPLRDDGYDIADFRDVNPAYGNLADVRAFIREAHARGLKVITELVCNHTSDQHPWFQRARRAPKGSAARAFYVWSDTPEPYGDARIIFKDFEASNWSWDPVAGQYFWHRFYSHQPDLNYDNPRVFEAITKTMDFWLDMGVDGLRLDAVPYLIEREGTSGENLPETHEILRRLRRHIDDAYGDRMLLAEANQWPEETAAYFGAGRGDECHMAFHFPIMPRLFMAIRMEDRFPIVDILAQTPDIPETAQWALFLRNHDELTLEMVTDEERDFMYRAYAADQQARINLGIRRRLAPLLGNNRRRIELMNGLMFALPGTPVVYYGDEIGMGDNVYLGDRNGVRTPMQWSGDRNAGFSGANRQKLILPPIVDPEYHYEAVNVEAQLANPHSLLWWMRRLIALRRRHPAFGRGAMRFVESDNRKVIAFIREHEGQRILVVANLSRYVQWTRLDLSSVAGTMPVEMFGSVDFPPAGHEPYFLSLGPHSFLWLELRADRPAHDASAPRPVLERPASVGELVTGRRQAGFVDALRAWMPGRRWYRGRTRRIRSIGVVDTIAIPTRHPSTGLVIVSVEYTEGEADRYVVVPSIVDHGLSEDDPTRIADLARDGSPAGHLVDAAADPDVIRWLSALIHDKDRVRGRGGELVGRPTRAFAATPSAALDQPVRPFRGEQSNTSAILDETSILKVFRLLEGGENPDVEIGRFLTAAGFAAVPPVRGWVDHRGRDGTVSSIATLQAYVANEGDVWEVARAAVDAFLDAALQSGAEAPATDTRVRALLAASSAPPPAGQDALIGPFLGLAELLGTRTGELHRALLGGTDAAFAPEPFTPFHQRSLYQSIRGLTNAVTRTLRAQLDQLPAGIRTDAEAVLASLPRVEARLQPLLRDKLGGRRIRIHGDYHTGQVLRVGGDVVITDFEGEPLRPLSERRIKRPALTDVAGMLRSFHYAAHGALIGRGDPATGELSRWADLWYASVAATFLRTYRAAVDGTELLPASEDGMEHLLDALLLQKAVYELQYELSARPDWLPIPIRGIRDALDG